MAAWDSMEGGKATFILTPAVSCFLIVSISHLSQQAEWSPHMGTKAQRQREEGTRSQEGKCASQLLADTAGQAVVTRVRLFSFRPRQNTRPGRGGYRSSGGQLCRRRISRGNEISTPEDSQAQLGGVVKKVQVSGSTVR